MLSALKLLAVSILGEEFGCERREGLETSHNDRLRLHLFSVFYCKHGKVHYFFLNMALINVTMQFL